MRVGGRIEERMGVQCPGAQGPPLLLLLLDSRYVTGPRRSLSLKLSDTRVYEPQRALLFMELFLEGFPPTLRKNVKRFRGGPVFKAQRLVYHSTLGSRVMQK